MCICPDDSGYEPDLFNQYDMLENNEIDRLLLAYKAGEISEADRVKLELWADESEENRMLLSLLTPDSDVVGELKTLNSYDKQRVWSNIRRETARARRRRVFRALARSGAAAVLLLGAIWGADMLHDRYQERDRLVSVIPPGSSTAVLELSSGMKIPLGQLEEQQLITEADKTEITINAKSTTFAPAREQTRNSGKTTPLFNRILVPKGGEYQLELSDGTKVWLNAQSEITFPTRFSGDTREVELRGEAYFEVEADPSHPFIVRTDQMSVRVVGTSFNIMTYGDEPVVETTLISGSLQVVKDDVETWLTPGMQARFDKESNTMTTRPVYAEGYAAWAKKMFVFFDEPIQSICRKLSRWYDVEIDASSESLDGICYSGMIGRAETFNSIAALLSATDELVFRERDGRVIVEKKK